MLKDNSSGSILRQFQNILLSFIVGLLPDWFDVVVHVALRLLLQRRTSEDCREVNSQDSVEEDRVHDSLIQNISFMINNLRIFLQ